MSDPSDPPRKFYGFKPREFDRVNASPVPPPISPPVSPAPVAPPASLSENPEPTAAASETLPAVASAPASTSTSTPAPGPIDVKTLFREAQLDAPLLRSAAEREKITVNEVHGILRDNHARADAAGLNKISLPAARVSRRRRDYWMLMLIGTALFGTMAVVSGLAVLAGNRGAAIPFVYSASGLVMFNAALWWVMWHIMEDY